MDLPGQKTLFFWKCSSIQVLIISPYFGYKRERNFGSGCCLRSKFSLLHMFQLYDLQFHSVVWKTTQYLVSNSTGPILSSLCSYTTNQHLLQCSFGVDRTIPVVFLFSLWLFLLNLSLNYHILLLAILKVWNCSELDHGPFIFMMYLCIHLYLFILMRYNWHTVLVWGV